MRSIGYHGLPVRLLGAITLSLMLIALARPARAQLTEEKLPGTNAPALGSNITPSPAASASPGQDVSSEWQRVSSSATGAAAVPSPAASLGAGLPGEMPASEMPAGEGSVSSSTDALATPAATPSAPPPALDLSATNVGPDLGAESLEPEVKRAATPARAASIRITERARRALLKNNIAGSLQDLGRAVSIDPGNSFAYYYLGRAYMARHNYAQAETFFARAELGLGARPDWLAETLSLDGAMDEQLGKPAEATAAYRRAVALAPGNFRAQVGLGRLAPSVGSASGVDQSPANEPDMPPPAEGAPPAAPAELPAPPP